MLRMLTVLALALPLVSLPVAQAEESNPQAQDLITLANHGISAHLMEVWIESQPRGPQPDSATILLLTKNKVPDSTIEALIRHNAAQAEARAAGTVTAVSGNASGYRVAASSDQPVYSVPQTTEVRYYDATPSYYDSGSYYSDPWWPGFSFSGGFFPSHGFHHGGFGFSSGFHHGGSGFGGHHR